MAPVGTPAINFPERKIRSRNTKSKKALFEDEPKTGNKILTRSPFKQARSPKSSPLISLSPLTLTTKSRLRTHRKALTFDDEENSENTHPNTPCKQTTSPKKKLSTIGQTELPTKIKILTDGKLSQSPVKAPSSFKSPLKEGLPCAGSPGKALLAPLSDRILRTPQKKALSDNEEDDERKQANDSPVRKSPRKMAKVGGILFRADVTHLVEVKRALSTALPPENAGLIGREKQLNIMKAFLERNMKAGENENKLGKRSLYVSGPPGTGKTTCLKHLTKVLQQQKLEAKKGSNEAVNRDTHCFFVNCMALKNSAAIYAKIAENIVPLAGLVDIGNSVDSQKKAVEDVILGSKVKKNILLVLDEIDQLDSKSQEVLYTIFEWPYLRNSKLILVGIANSLDLTDRILPRLKLREKLCPEELTFPAYSRDEINSIITSRLESISKHQNQVVIKPGAIRFLSAKISALSGDVRKALDVCRRAIELAEVEIRKQTLLATPNSGSNFGSFKPIDIPQILKIVNEVYCSSTATAALKETNSDLPLQQKILVASLLLMTNYGKRPIKEVTAAKLHETYTKLCKKRSMSALNLSEVLSLCSLLDARGFFSSRKILGKKLTTSDIRISLRIDEDEVQAALKDKALLSGILRDTDCICK